MTYLSRIDRFRKWSTLFFGLFSSKIEHGFTKFASIWKQIEKKHNTVNCGWFNIEIYSREYCVSVCAWKKILVSVLNNRYGWNAFSRQHSLLDVLRVHRFSYIIISFCRIYFFHVFCLPKKTANILLTSLIQFRS